MVRSMLELVEGRITGLEWLGLLTVADRETQFCPDCDEPRHHGGVAALTSSGVRITVDLAREEGLDRPDPAVASADQLVDKVGNTDPGVWEANARTWFATRPDSDSLDPQRLLSGLVAVLAAILDGGGPDDLIDMLGPAPADMITTVWRLEHSRVADVLDALGSAHPDRRVAKAVRTALATHRSMAADRTSRRR